MNKKVTVKAVKYLLIMLKIKKDCVKSTILFIFFFTVHSSFTVEK